MFATNSTKRGTDKSLVTTVFKSRTRSHLVSSIGSFEAVDANIPHGKRVQTAQHARSSSIKTLIQQTTIIQTPLVSDSIHYANTLWRLPQARAPRHVLPPPQHGDQQQRQIAPNKISSVLMLLQWVSTTTKTRRNVALSHVSRNTRISAPHSSYSMLQKLLALAYPETGARMQGYNPLKMID